MMNLVFVVLCSFLLGLYVQDFLNLCFSPDVKGKKSRITYKVLCILLLLVALVAQMVVVAGQIGG